MEQDQIIIQSPERIVHFQCPFCQGWWSVGDAPKRPRWCCTWCGKWSLVKGDTFPVAMSDPSPASHSQTEQVTK